MKPFYLHYHRWHKQDVWELINPFLWKIVVFSLFANPLVGYSFQLQSLSPTPEKATDDLPFLPFEMKWENSNNAKLNLSFLLDKPAGRDGFIKIKDGHFVKPSGERFKIWGVNLAFGACFPDKSDAPKVAAYLARFGVNGVRLHFLDAEWGKERSLMNNGKDNTRELSAKQFDKLDFFVNELKKAGVYSNINLNVGRQYRDGDDVPQREILGLGKGATLFSDRLIELQKEYAKQLLTHFNPYTGNTYANEPAVAVIEILNENSLVEAWLTKRLLGKATTPQKSIWSDIPTGYGEELTLKYNAWLKENVTQRDLQVLQQETNVLPGKNIPRLEPGQFKEASEFRFNCEAKFIIEAERNFFTGMYHYMKDQLGVKSLITANSDADHSTSSYAFLSNASLLDYVDGHVYWHYYGSLVDEKTGKEKWGRRDNVPMVTVPDMSTVVQLSRSPVEGMPYTVSETNNGSNNEYASEVIPITGAYAALQDWDGIFYFALAHVEPNEWKTFIPGGLDLVIDPIRMANLAASGLMYLRGDVKSAKTTIMRGYSEKDIIDGMKEPMGDRYLYTKGFSPRIPLIYKTRIESFNRHVHDFPQVQNSNVIVSETGEINWRPDDDKSYVEISTDKSESLIGFVPSNTTSLKHLEVNVKNKFASITLTSLEDKPITVSKKMLLVTTAKASLTNVIWNEDKTRMISKGELPLRIEVVSGNILIKGLKNARKLILEPLDGSGNPIRSSTVSVKNGNASFKVGNDTTVWYYISVQ